MAKAAKIKIRMVSTAGTGTTKVTKRNPKSQGEKLQLKKFDKRAIHPVTGKPGAHVLFKEEKMK